MRDLQGQIGLQSVPISPYVSLYLPVLGARPPGPDRAAERLRAPLELGQEPAGATLPGEGEGEVEGEGEGEGEGYSWSVSVIR